MPTVVNKQKNNAVEGGSRNGRVECLPLWTNEKTTLFGNGEGTEESNACRRRQTNQRAVFSDIPAVPYYSQESRLH